MSKSQGEITILPNQGVWSHPAFKPDHPFTPNAKQKPLLHETSNEVMLQLPMVVARNCRELLKGAIDGKTIGQSLGLNKDLVQKKIQSFVLDMREKLGMSRLSQARLYNYGMNQLLGVTQDPALQAHVFWTDPGISAQPYYAVFTADQIQYSYAKCLEPLFGETAHSSRYDYQVGSNLLVKKNVLRQWIVKWVNDIELSKKERGLNKLIMVHNDLTKFVLMMLMSVTTHRSVSDPFESYCLFDFVTKTAVIQDKMFGGKNSGRLVWLIDMVIIQLEKYKAHLQGLASRIIAYDRALSERICKASKGCGDLPFFFFLRRSELNKNIPQPFQITGKVLREVLGINLSANLCRTYFRTHLVRMGVPVEFVNYQLGHVSTGQEFDGDFSVLSVGDIQEIIEPKITEFMERLGWFVVDGLREFKTTPSRVKIDQINWEFGAVSRYKKREKESALFEKRVVKTMDRCQISEASEDNIKGLLKLIKNEFEGCGKNRALNIAEKILRKRYFEIDEILDTTWPCAIKIPDARKSKFDVKIINLLRKGREERLKLDKWIIERDSPLNKAEGVALMIASAVLYGGMCDVSYVKQLIGCPIYSLNGTLWAELNEKDRYKKNPRRWFFDVTSAFVYLTVIEKFKDISSVSWFEVERCIRRNLNVSGLIELCSNALALYRFELPSYVVAYISGNLISFSVSLENWLRIVSGKGFLLGEDKEVEGSKVTAPKSILNYKLSMNYRAGKNTIRRIQKLLKTANVTPWLLPRSELILKIEILLDDIIEEPGFLNIWLVYLLKLLKDGRKKPDLTISTVRTYFNKLSRHLHEATWEIENLDFLDESGIEHLYHEMLSFTTDKNRPKLANILHGFHDYLIKKHGFPEVDFHKIEPRSVLQPVRTAIVTERELKLNCLQLPRASRVHQLLSVKGRMRTAELRNLKPNNIHFSPIFIDIESAVGRKTKTVSGKRKVLFPLSIPEKEVKSLKDFVDHALDANIKRFNVIITERSRRQLQQKIRRLTGDQNFVTHGFRDTGITAAIIRAVLPENLWPPGLLEYDSDRINEAEWRAMHQIYFQSVHKSRRILFQEASSAGHSNPEMTFSAYFHCMDWIQFAYCNLQLKIGYKALSKLSYKTYENLRQLKYRNNDVSFARSLLRNGLSRVNVPAPDIVKKMITYNPDACVHEDRYPTSLKLVVEVIRLHLKGENSDVIAEKLEIKPDSVALWIKNMVQVRHYVGYNFDNTFVTKRVWFDVDLSVVCNEFDRLICCRGRPDGTVWDLLLPFKDHYMSSKAELYLLDRVAVKSFIEGLDKLAINRDQLMLVVSKNHSISQEGSFGFYSLADLGIKRIKQLGKTIKVRSGAAQTKPGLGVKIEGRSSVDARYLLRDELFLLMAASWCVFGI